MSGRLFLSWEAAVDWLRSQPEREELVTACYYDLPLEVAASRYHLSAEWSAVRKLLPVGKGLALDVGAGHGITTFALSKDGWQVISLEPDPSEKVGAGAIRELAARADLQVRVMQEFGEEIPLPDGTCDLVLARQALHHARDLSTLCQEIARVLKPGGVFIALRDHVISRRRDLPRFLAEHPLHELYGGENAYLLKDYRNAIESAGLRIVRIIRPLESVINYAPHDESSLREEMARRVERLVLIGIVCGKVIRRSSIAFQVLRSLLSRIDNRPGRAYSFVCSKP